MEKLGPETLLLSELNCGLLKVGLPLSVTAVSLFSEVPTPPRPCPNFPEA